MGNAEWLFKINLRITDEISWDAVENLSKDIISSLNRIIPLIKNFDLKEEMNWVIGSLEDVRNDADFRLTDRNDKDMSLEDSVEECNYILENLYDLSDCKFLVNGEKRKFIWINKI